MLNGHNGIKLFGQPSKYIYDNVVDMDFSSMYPFIIISFNIAPNCMVGKLLINAEYNEVLKESLDGNIDDMGKDFIDNLLTENPSVMGSKWFSLPKIDTLIEELEKEFGLNHNREYMQLSIPEGFLDTGYVIKLDV